ncbi:hypothetical protein ACI2UK_13815 [Ralstonia nicotianae]|uniref:hypothetical protein n=1 Tax=Ralstonia pseudosolanacearum TaxID=1310165 RepID=UPI0020037C2C|nr:hypothetical protein [Ralstonia pseudosolanacearum]MCK4118380.1 hypothetical protein [Ralstonia pseudosolanacearum]
MDILKILARLLFSYDDRPAYTSRAQPRPPAVVGAGGDNEVQVIIRDAPHLFRDEGEYVAHFVAEFDCHLAETPFGTKLLPAVAPHWALKQIHKDVGIAHVVAQTIRESDDRAAPRGPRHRVPSEPSVAPAKEERQMEVPQRITHGGRENPPTHQPPTSKSRAVYHGRIEWWGEASFPDRKRAGEFYQSFAVKLHTATGPQTLQGEGLKDVLSEGQCSIGDIVEIKRLRKIKVPAFDTRGAPLLDGNGNQKLYDKWLWSVSLAH